MTLDSDDALAAVLRLRRFRRHFATAHRVRTDVAHRMTAAPTPNPPRWLSAAVQVSRGRIGPWRSYTVSPRRPAQHSDRHVLFFHGGAYVQEITAWHWAFVARVASATGSVITVPIYPLAPESTVLQTIPAAVEVTRALAMSRGPLTVLADSAGAGIALTVAQEFRDGAEHLIDRFAFVSPWLDIRMSQPIAAEVAARDRILGAAGLAEAGRLYAGSAGTRHPWLDPLGRSLTGLAPITIFSGTNDILNIDSKRLHERACADGCKATLVETVDAQHDYLLFPTAAGRSGFRTLRDVVNSPS